MHVYVATDRIVTWLAFHEDWSWHPIVFERVHDGVPVWTTAIENDDTEQLLRVQADSPDRAVVALAGLITRMGATDDQRLRATSDR